MTGRHRSYSDITSPSKIVNWDPLMRPGLAYGQWGRLDRIQIYLSHLGKDCSEDNNSDFVFKNMPFLSNPVAASSKNEFLPLSNHNPKNVLCHKDSC